MQHPKAAPQDTEETRPNKALFLCPTEEDRSLLEGLNFTFCNYSVTTPDEFNTGVRKTTYDFIMIIMLAKYDNIAVFEENADFFEHYLNAPIQGICGDCAWLT